MYHSWVTVEIHWPVTASKWNCVIQNFMNNFLHIAVCFMDGYCHIIQRPLLKINKSVTDICYLDYLVSHPHHCPPRRLESRRCHHLYQGGLVFHRCRRHHPCDLVFRHHLSPSLSHLEIYRRHHHHLKQEKSEWVIS